MEKVLIAGWVGLIGFAAVAKPLFFEPFDYGAGGKISLQKGGVGFAGHWSDKSGTKGDIYAGWSGLTFGEMPVSGIAMTMDMAANQANDGINIVRPVGTALESGSLWVSFLYKFDGDSSVAFVNQLQTFVRLQSKGDKTIRFRMRANSLDSGGIAVRQSGAKGNEGSWPEPSLADGNVYLLIAEFPELGTVEGGAPSLWSFSEAGYAALKKKSGSVSREDLTAHCVSRAVGAQAPATVKADDFITVGVWAREANTAVAITYDELRGGTELADVLKF